jgi:restriction system protein
MRKDLYAYNNLLRRTFIDIPFSPAKGVISRSGTKLIKIDWINKFVRRIFNNSSWNEGGRYYGGWWQRIPKEWREKIAQLESARKSAIQEHKRAEARRLKELEVAKERYAKECAAREAEAASMNAEIDKFIADLGYGTVEAVQKYVEIVLANSTYPDHFPITHDFSFAPATAELKLKVLVPPPEELSSIKAYKYTKTSDEISSTTLSQKAQKDRYQGAVHQVALRSIHEVFEADRRELIQTISLEVGTETLHPATGLEAFIPFVAVACERAAFQEFDLSAIVPLATLEHLGAALSKNPFGLVAADTKGVRRT